MAEDELPAAAPALLAKGLDNLTRLEMLVPLTMRVARPTDNLSEVADMYARGLGLSVLSQFHDHDGFDGVVLGHPNQAYHIEFTTHRGHKVGRAPTEDHLLAFYIPGRAEWEERCSRMVAAGFRPVRSYNPYWDVAGSTFEDLDGYRVVLRNERYER